MGIIFGKSDGDDRTIYYDPLGQPLYHRIAQTTFNMVQVRAAELSYPQAQ
jgi:hypothetical protein